MNRNYLYVVLLIKREVLIKNANYTVAGWQAPNWLTFLITYMLRANMFGQKKWRVFFAVPFSFVLMYTYYHGIIDHSGITFKRHWWQPWQPDCIFHDNHHQYFHVNFGFNIEYWDKVCFFLNPKDYPILLHSIDRVRHENFEKKLKNLMLSALFMYLLNC